MYKKKKKYELEVHFGLLVLVIIMLCLNIVSNYVIYNTNNIFKDEINSDLYKSSLILSRYIQNNHVTLISKADKKQFLYKYKLDNIFLLPSMPKAFSKEAKLQWLNSILFQVPKEDILKISGIILTSEFYTLTRGENDQYYYVSPVSKGRNNNILILSKKIHKLAYLDDASDTLVIISMVALFAIMLIYYLLYRFILSPFQKLKENAKSAGRTIPSESYEVNSVIDEYQAIIKELKESKSELVELHKEASTRAESFEQFNEYLLGSMQAGIITIDKSGKILTINKAAENICGLESSLFVGVDFNQLPYLFDSLKGKINQTLTNKIYHTYEEYEFRNPHLRIGITISPICDSKTHQIGASILINDISKIKALQSEIEKNRQMSALGEMSAGLAHQLRNSLGAIVGYNQLMKKRLTQNNIETSTIDMMALELRESEMLIKRFLNFTKPFDYSPEKEYIIPFIEDIIDTLSIRNDFTHIKLNFENKLHHNTCIDIDQLLLKQALTNIIENSKNAYSDKNGVIDIIIYDNDNDFIITIQDYGCGIDKDKIKKIFTPFYSTSPSGTGLGLPLAQKIIALHNGQLLVESTCGEGTVFKIIIPFENSAQKEKTENFLSNSK